jgi:hypothetical protein
MSEKLFHIHCVNVKTKKVTVMTSSPLIHHDACTMLSKFTNHDHAELILVEAKL